MLYSKIVTLRNMRPAYNIKEESQGEWKSFIANDQFNEILTKTIRAVRNNDADTHKSIWIAGTYGTGKSHAGAEIQHLLCDPVDDIREYVEDEYRKSKGEPPQGMQILYEILHRKSIEQAAAVKGMLALYKENFK